MASVIHVNFALLPESVSASWVEDRIQAIPIPWREKILSFKRTEDQARSLVGRLLLLKAVERHQIHSTEFQIRYEQRGRPYMAGMPNFDFNITHSHRLVVCASSRQLRVGLDVEHLRPVAFEDLSSALGLDQWQIVNQSKDPIGAFFSFWTIKEAVIKADGRAFYSPLDQMRFERNTVVLDDKVYHLKKLELAAGYTGHLAYSGPNEAVEIQIESVAI